MQIVNDVNDNHTKFKLGAGAMVSISLSESAACMSIAMARWPGSQGIHLATSSHKPLVSFTQILYGSKED